MTAEALEPESWERNALLWTARKVERVQSAVRGIFVGLGLFWISLGLLIASLVFPAVRLFLLFATAAVAVLFGVWFVSLGLRFSSRLGESIDHMHEMAQMTNVERHAHVARKVRRRPSTARARPKGGVYASHGRRSPGHLAARTYPVSRRSRARRRHREQLRRLYP